MLCAGSDAHHRRAHSCEHEGGFVGAFAGMSKSLLGGPSLPCPPTLPGPRRQRSCATRAGSLTAEPAEGAAVAQASMEELLSRGAVRVATTHSAALKRYAMAEARLPLILARRASSSSLKRRR